MTDTNKNHVTQKQNIMDKRDRWVDLLFFLALFACACGVTLFLFHHQTIGNESSYHSDMKAYILEMQGLDSGYSFPYPVFFKLSALFHLLTNAEFAVALATMVLNGFAMVMMKYYLNMYALAPLKGRFSKIKMLEKASFLPGICISILAISLFFISMVYFPGGYILPGLRFKYLGVFTANPFHNATYMAARPFAIMAFFSYAKLLDTYEEKAPLKDYIFFTVTLLLATMTKPSFTIVLVGAAGLIMLFRMFKTKFKNFLPTMYLGFCFLPTFADLLYQFKGVFMPDTGVEGGMGFCFGEVWGLYCKNFPAAIALAIGFPITVFVFHYKDILKNTIYRFSWQIYGMSFAMAFLLYEKGFRKPDFNFSWGYMYGIFFAFVGAVVLLLTSDKGLFVEDEKNSGKLRPRISVIIEWTAYLAHLVCGLYYFYGFLKGNMYY